LIGRRRDDVADLGRDFDRMAQQLQALIAAQRALLHDVSHELRSPLARLQAAIGLARQSPGKTEASLERIEREAERVDELVGELLTLSRLEARIGQEARQREQDVDVVDLVAAVVADAEFEAQATGRGVTLSGADELIADVEPELLHRAFENIIRNAVRLTREGTTVEVEVEADAADGFRVRVADRGPGVPETERERIFEPFHRVSSGESGAGFGLGLAIARRAIEAHGGSVRVSDREGGGLVVEIVIPPPRRPSFS
jgi:two-component system OmpR family sensor kinase